MAIQLVRNQLVDSIINVDKLLDGAVSYAKINPSDIETSLSGASNKLASQMLDALTGDYELVAFRRRSGKLT